MKENDKYGVFECDWCSDDKKEKKPIAKLYEGVHWMMSICEQCDTELYGKGMGFWH